jgi:ketosteroid isomerase-like protein
VEGVFMPLVQDYEGFTVKPESFVAEGDMVISVGWYEGRYKATGKVARARFAHVWTVRDGKMTRFEQIVDSATFNAALS